MVFPSKKKIYSVMVVSGFERDGEIGLDLKNSEAVVGFNFENQ